MMPRLLVVLACVLCTVTAFAADEIPPCSAPEFRAFDFWVGDWRVTDADGNYVGDNTIASEEAGCVLVEHWRSARGGTGQSLNFFDPARAKWRQLWISPGSRIEIEGGVVGDYMILEGTIWYLASGESYPFRGSWRVLPDRRVRQFFEESRESGVWKEWFEGFYTRQ